MPPQSAGPRIALKSSLALALLVVAALSASPAAFAQQTDPDSPAGVEYELPLDRARSEANGGGEEARSTPGRRAGRTDRRDQATPLFGQGIPKADEGRGGGRSPATGSGRTLRRGATNGSEAEAIASSKSAPKQDSERPGNGTRVAASTGDDSPLGLLAMIVLGVLVLGGGLALVLRRTVGRPGR